MNEDVFFIVLRGGADVNPLSATQVIRGFSRYAEES